jgi:hypothetical protein
MIATPLSGQVLTLPCLLSAGPIQGFAGPLRARAETVMQRPLSARGPTAFLDSLAMV